MMESVEVLLMPQLADEALQRIQSVDRRIKIIDARGWFDVELRATWPQWTAERYIGARKSPASSLQERNQVLAAAEVVLTGWPPLKDLRARAPLAMGARASRRRQQFSRYRSLGLEYFGDHIARADQSASHGRVCAGELSPFRSRTSPKLRRKTAPQIRSPSLPFHNS